MFIRVFYGVGILVLLFDFFISRVGKNSWEFYWDKNSCGWGSYLYG